MECKCPNCKGDAMTKVIDGVNYIRCKACGWFITQPEGSCEPCEAPNETTTAAASGQPTEPPARAAVGGAAAVDAAPLGPDQSTPSVAGHAGGGSPPSPAPSFDENKGDLEIVLIDEIDY